ncbi:MAG: Bacterial Ig-like domain (group 2) [Tenericutes bacterium ADurb.BinA155]|nr:MAG: Bacterial Ig-like domain (group 2) [Tenericutes bacterium ADurb.BinA155]
MKKTISILTLSAAVFALSACGSTNVSSVAPASSSGAATSSGTTTSSGASSSSSSSAATGSSASSNPKTFTINFTSVGLPTTGTIAEGSAFYTTDSTYVDGVSPDSCYPMSGKSYISLGASTTMGSLVISLNGNLACTSFSVSAMGIVASGASLKVTSKAAGVNETIAMTAKTALDYTYEGFSKNAAVTPQIILTSVGKVVRLASVTIGYSFGTPIAASGVSIDQQGNDAKVGLGAYNAKTFTATVTPSNASYQSVTWTSADPTIATVGAKTGLVTGLKLGQTTITATDYSGVYTGTTTVDVYNPMDNMLNSANDFEDFGGSTKAADRSGTNYKSTASTLNYTQVEAASQTDVLQASPESGVSNILVIPVHVQGEDAHATDTVRNDIYKTFFGKPSDTGWESLASYYYKSSYQQLKLEGSVTEWYDLPYTKSELATLSDSAWGTTYNPTWDVLESAVKWARSRYSTDLKAFDNNNDGYLDGVWMVYSCDFDETNTDLWWAFTYNDYRTNSSTTLPTPSKYCWASYSFIYEGYSTSAVDAHTYIHETGHMMGLDDYYTYDGGVGPIGGLDMMDYNIIDHDVFSKFAYGWIHPMVVSGACEITLNSAAETGESILIPTGDSWNGTAFDEYLLLEYYTPTVLNQKDSEAKYPGNSKQGFTERGVRIFHVDARLVTNEYNGSWGAYSYTDTLKYVEPYKDDSGVTHATFTMVAASNSIKRSKSGLNSAFKLISLIPADNVLLTKNGATNAALFKNGDSFSVSKYGANFLANTNTMNDGTTEPYALSFSDSTTSSIKVTVTAA